MANEEQDMQFDSEGDQNSVESFEKQLQQQEMEMKKEQMKNATEETAEDWRGQETDMEVTNGNGDALDNRESSGTKRSTEDLSKDSTALDSSEPPSKKGKQDEVCKLWSAVKENEDDFQAWTNLLQYIDQQSELEAGREAYTAFFGRYPYCYGYWKKYADLEKRKGTQESTLQVFERGLLAIPLSVDLWVHYLDYVTNTFLKEEEESFVRSQFERAVQSCGLEYKSDKMWEAFVSWETTHKRWHRVTSVYDKLLATPTAKYAHHWTKFQEHAKKHPVTEVITLTEFMTHRNALAKKEDEAEDAEEEAPPGVEDDKTDTAVTNTLVETPASAKLEVTEEECKLIQVELLSTREKLHLLTSEEVKVRAAYEDAIKRPYFHVKPLEKSQLQAWRDYIVFEQEKGTEMRLRTLYERCLIATALYEEFWLRYIDYLDSLSTVTASEMRDVFERCCNVHLRNKLKPHLAWALFEEEQEDCEAALRLLNCLHTRVPDALEPWVQRASLERRRGRLEEAEGVFCDGLKHYEAKGEGILSLPHANLLVKYSRFLYFCRKDHHRAIEILETVATEKCDSKTELTSDEQKAVEVLLWALFERHISSSIPDVKAALTLLSKGTRPIFSPTTRILFATRRHQMVLEFGCGGETVRESAKSLRQLEESLKSFLNDKSKEEQADSARGKKNGKGDKSGQQNGAQYGVGPYQQYPTSGSPQQPPPQQPGAQGGAYGGYNNQTYPPQGGTGGYPPQQYQQWGYPPQGGNYGYGNQQQWGGYNNYYGGQR